MDVSRATLAKVLVGVFVFNLVVMGAGAWYSAQQTPPIPDRVVGPDGDPVTTRADVQTGKAVFQQNGLMNHGSILGNGAYFGPDYTADTLDLKVQFMRRYYARERAGAAYESLPDPSGLRRERRLTTTCGSIPTRRRVRLAHEELSTLSSGRVTPVLLSGTQLVSHHPLI